MYSTFRSFRFEEKGIRELGACLSVRCVICFELVCFCVRSMIDTPEMEGGGGFVCAHLHVYVSVLSVPGPGPLTVRFLCTCMQCVTWAWACVHLAQTISAQDLPQ